MVLPAHDNPACFVRIAGKVPFPQHFGLRGPHCGAKMTTLVNGTRSITHHKTTDFSQIARARIAYTL